MAAFEDEMDRRRRAYKEEMDRRQSQATRNRLVSAGLWSPPLQEPPQQPGPQDAPQNAQNAPGRQVAVNAAPMPPRANWFDAVHQRADEQLERVLATARRMAAHTEQGFRDENNSRVAQAREIRRMEFARQMEQMRHENLLQRLAMEQSPQRSSPLIFDSLVKRSSSPWMVRSLNPATGTWEYTDPDENGNIAFGG